MPTDQLETTEIKFPLVETGFEYQFLNRLFHVRSTPLIRLIRILILVTVTWVPLLILAIGSGHALSGIVDVPLLHDPSLYGRFLFVLPVLEVAEVLVARSLAVQAKHFIDSKIVGAQDKPKFVESAKSVLDVRSSVYSEFTIAFLALCISIIARLVVLRSEVTSWERLGSNVTPAGWWYALVSLPILLFFLIRWLFIFVLWTWFLNRVSKLDLSLSATHPDHAGGLGFLGWGLASFSAVLIAVSAILSAGFYYEILHKNESLNSLKYHVIIFVVLALFLIHAPLISFSAKLSRCRFKSLLDYSALALRHDREFDEKWIDQSATQTTDVLLGSADIQSLADIGTIYEHVNEMRLLPFDRKAFLVLTVSALLPMIPLVGTEIPLQEIFSKLLELAV